MEASETFQVDVGQGAAEGSPESQGPPEWLGEYEQSFVNQLAGLGEREPGGYDGLEPDEFGDDGDELSPYGDGGRYFGADAPEDPGGEGGEDGVYGDIEDSPFAEHFGDGEPSGDRMLDRLVEQFDQSERVAATHERLDRVEEELGARAWNDLAEEFPLAMQDGPLRDSMERAVSDTAADLGLEVDLAGPVGAGLARMVILSQAGERFLAEQESRRLPDDRGVSLEGDGGTPSEPEPPSDPSSRFVAAAQAAAKSPAKRMSERMWK
jgi:hypothetical protein